MPAPTRRTSAGPSARPSLLPNQPRRHKPGSARVKANEAEALAASLAGHPDYRVVRRLQAAERPALASKLVRHAAVVDTETTGTDPSTDKIIELAIVVFEYCAESGVVGRVVGRYDAFEDPG